MLVHISMYHHVAKHKGMCHNVPQCLYEYVPTTYMSR